MTNDEVNNKVLKAVDHIEWLLANNKIPLKEYNDFMLELGRWAYSKRKENGENDY